MTAGHAIVGIRIPILPSSPELAHYDDGYGRIPQRRGAAKCAVWINIWTARRRARSPLEP